MRYPGYSFCIISNGRRREKLRQLIDSIRWQQIPTYQIIVAGKAESRDDIIYIPMEEAAREGKISLMRNTAAEHSKYDCIVFLDDDIVLTPTWIDGVVKALPTTDLIATRLLNLDGTRHWDWASTGGQRGQILLDYNTRDSFIYLTGGNIIAKAYVWETVRWDPNLGYGEKEDVVFSRDAFMKGFNCKPCTESTSIHNDERYTQIGRVNWMRSSEGATLWLTNGLQHLTTEQLIVRAAQELSRKRIPEAVDCLRYAIHKDPHCQPAQWQLAAIDSYCGGPVESGNWQPFPITQFYGIA
jgi:Glycosyl transferase family 2